MRAENWESEGRESLRTAEEGYRKAHGECAVPVGDGPTGDGEEGRRGTGVGASSKGEDEQESAGERRRVREGERW